MRVASASCQQFCMWYPSRSLSANRRTRQACQRPGRGSRNHRVPFVKFLPVTGQGGVGEVGGEDDRPEWGGQGTAGSVAEHSGPALPRPIRPGPLPTHHPRPCQQCPHPLGPPHQVRLFCFPALRLHHPLGPTPPPPPPPPRPLPLPKANSAHAVNRA